MSPLGSSRSGSDVLVPEPQGWPRGGETAAPLGFPRWLWARQGRPSGSTIRLRPAGLPVIVLSKRLLSVSRHARASGFAEAPEIGCASNRGSAQARHGLGLTRRGGVCEGARPGRARPDDVDPEPVVIQRPDAELVRTGEAESGRHSLLVGRDSHLRELARACSGRSNPHTLRSCASRSSA